VLIRAASQVREEARERRDVHSAGVRKLSIRRAKQRGGVCAVLKVGLCRVRRRVVAFGGRALGSSRDIIAVYAEQRRRGVMWRD